MDLKPEEIQFYEQNGYLLIQDCFSKAEIARMKAELQDVFAEDSPRRVVEKDGYTVRSVYGCHKYNEVFSRLVRHSNMLVPARQLLGDDVYVYQFKINAKVAFRGDLWEWHQDYVFWMKEDGMPEPRATNAVVFLDEVNELNGPLVFIPGSHREGVLDSPALTDENAANSSGAYKGSPSWISNLTANLKYSLSQDTIATLIQRYGTAVPKGPAGSMLFFHPNIVHTSSNNLSPFDRVLVLITYNSVGNLPNFPKNRRPDFLASSDCEPLKPT